MGARSTSTVSRPSAPKPDAYAWVALANTTAAIFMAALDGSVVIIALPAIFKGINLDPLGPGNISYLLWMIMGYRLVQAVLVVNLGKLVLAEPGAERRRELLGARAALVVHGPKPRLGDRQHDPPAVFRVAAALDQAALQQRRHGHAHRLRADPVLPGEVARGRGPAALKAGKRRGLGEGQLARERRLPQLAHDKPHGDAQRPRHLTDIRDRST